MSFNFTPLDQAYQIHHVNQNTYSSLNTAKYSPKCMFCGCQESVPLMASQDKGAFRQCINQSCRKQFQATILSAPVANYQLSTQQQVQNQQQQNQQQVQNQQQQQNQEPQFISKFKNNY
jgi:transcription elongation factor Elf1